MVNSSTRRSSDSRSGVQYAVDVEESMVTDTGEEIHKHGPPVQYTPRGSVNVHSLAELQRGRMSSVGSSPDAPEYFNCIDTGTVYRFLVNDKDDTCCGLFVAMATATVQIIVYALLLLMIVVRGEGEDMCGDVEMAEGCDVMTVVGSNDNDTMTIGRPKWIRTIRRPSTWATSRRTWRRRPTAAARGRRCTTRAATRRRTDSSLGGWMAK